ncbi:MAG TPA: hypothetical protein VFU19_05620, partial [Iamia sp.]|nr:hypothetical protein [Iamia sp.]
MTDTLSPALAALARVPSPVTWDEVAARAASGPSAPIPLVDPPGRSRWPRLAVAAVAAAVLVVAGMAVWPDDDPGQDVRIDPTTTPVAPEPTDPAGPTAPSTPGEPWTEPDGTRGTAVIAATDDGRYLVWGGYDRTYADRNRIDGFVVDVATGAAVVIPPAPIAPGYGNLGAWTGTELVVWSSYELVCSAGCDEDPQAAAWDPATGAWRTIAAPPAAVTQPGTDAVWTGEEVVTLGGQGEAVGAAYDPDDDTWRDVPGLPTELGGGRAVDLVWTGDEVVAWVGDVEYGTGDPGGTIVDRGYRWAPGDDAWTPLPDLPDGFRTDVGSVAWTGDELVVWGMPTGVGDLLRSPTGRTEQVAGVGARWRPGDDAWRPMAPSPAAPAVLGDEP